MQLFEIDLSAKMPVRKQVVIYAKDGNTVVRPYKNLYPVNTLDGAEETKENYYLEKITYECGSPTYMIYQDIEGFCCRLGQVGESQEVSAMSPLLNALPYPGKDGYLKRLEIRKEKGGFISLIDIEFCRYIGRRDLVHEYSGYRESFMRQQEDRERREKEIREEEERIKRAEEAAVYEKVISDAVLSFYNKMPVENQRMDDGNTLILHLMRKYDIHVPLRTQGWINERLAKIEYRDGAVTYRYYTSGKDSSVFYKYLQELERRIRSSFSVGICPVCGNEEIRESDQFCFICGCHLKEVAHATK